MAMKKSRKQKVKTFRYIAMYRMLFWVYTVRVPCIVCNRRDEEGG